MKIILSFPSRAPTPISSFDAHYERAENLMPHEPLALPTVMKLPSRKWYKRLWTWFVGIAT